MNKVMAKLIWMAVIGGTMASANGDIAYNSFAANDGYDTGGWGVGGDGSGGAGVAMQFTSATSGSVTAITMALEGNYNYNISINEDSDGLPGAAMESWQGVAGLSGPTPVVGDGSASLSAGTLYWVVVLPDGGGATTGGWYWGIYDSKVAFNQDGGSWYAEHGAGSAYRVETMPVPEPSAAEVVGFGAAAVVAGKARRRQVRRGARSASKPVGPQT